MTQIYNDPAGGDASSIGTQFRTDHYDRKALIEARRLQYFMPLSGTVNMPKNMGKTIKKYHYLAILDDANVNDQGLDAAGATLVDGNLYGSSKDIGTIVGKIPALTENGGKVNRVGFTRKEVQGSIEKRGFHSDYTQESLDFDTDADLQMHIWREMVNAAHEITEDSLQIDLLNSAGVIRFPGAATQDSEITEATVADYGDLLRLSIDLDDNRTPKQTKVITGTRLVDTKVLPASRVMFIGTELIPLIEAMVDGHGNPALIRVANYAAGGTVLNGEIGSIGYFRIVVVPEMLKWAGAGGDASATTTHYETGDAYDVLPMLVVGDGAFTTIGFQSNGDSVKFKVKHAKPGSPESYAQDRFGETGFMSIKWYYGFLLERPERIGLVKTAAPL